MSRDIIYHSEDTYYPHAMVLKGDLKDCFPCLKLDIKGCSLQIDITPDTAEFFREIAHEVDAAWKAKAERVAA